jgi:homoserine dehydrogenase
MTRHIPVLIFGAGGVGRSLLEQIVASRAVVEGRNQARFEVVGVVDSRSWRFQPAGLSDDELRELVALKKRRQPLGPPERPANLELLAEVAASGVDGLTVIDVTAEAGMEPMIQRALELGCGVVLANKKPLAGPWSVAGPFFHNIQLRHESTVGGGQPVIATLRYLLDTNDPPERIEGQMSGTLGYICARMDEGAPFSQALAEAKAKGYTEPDPREDLGGRDVRRKLLILGRMAGWPVEESDVEVESLFPLALAHRSVTEFMAAAVAMDPPLRDRISAAAAAGEVLRYVAVFEDGRGSVGLQALPVENPTVNLKYTSFRTAIYHDQPLLVGGKGAGVEMTAAGVLGDMIDLAREWR